MKLSKIAAFSLAAVALASCASEDALKQPVAQDKDAISFSIYNEEAGSRGVIKTNTSLKFNDGFAVWANVNTIGSSKTESLFSNQAVNWDGTNNVWAYAPVKYWPTSADATVDFYAIHTDKGRPQNYDVNTDWNNIPQVTFQVNPEVSKQSDFLWAQPLLNQSRGQYSADAKVPFTFQHALTGHYFAFKTEKNYSDKIKKFVINSITLTGYFAPKAYLNPRETDINKIWTLDGDWEERSYTISLDNKGIDEALFTANNWADGTERVVTSQNSQWQPGDANFEEDPDNTYTTGTTVPAPKCDYIMVLPFNPNPSTYPGQEFTWENKVTINYTIYTEGTEVDASGAKILVPQTLEAKGKVFNTAKPGYMNCNVITLSLQEIKIDAKVEDWKIAGNGRTTVTF